MICIYIYYPNKICNLCNMALNGIVKAVFSLHIFAQIAQQL